MKVIEVTHPIQKDQLINENVAMAFGFFDGMHRGHDKVFQALNQKAEENNLKKAVMTFDPHPSVVLNPERKRTTYLTPLSDKLEMIEQHDVDYCIVINFSSRFASVTSEEFIQEYVINNNVKDSEKISTTAIREALTEGNLRKANEELGYLYRIKGTVVQGEKRGRTIGFPTANVQPSDDYVLPKKGVYAVSMEIGPESKIYRGVANVGVKPTFHDPAKAEVVIEVNIFDFDENIYGERVIVYWHYFLRPEVKFSGIDPLVEQMNEDKARAKYLLSVDFGDDISYNI